MRMPKSSSLSTQAPIPDATDRKSTRPTVRAAAGMLGRSGFVAAFTALAAAAGFAPGLSAAPKPNLVLILADDLGWGDVGYHGGEAKTPNIDRVSAEGLRFDRFYSQPICTPTRAALMTGRYPWRCGMASGVILNHLRYGLPLDETTLAQTLKGAGYATAIVGKWHLGHETPAHLPTERGFDTHYGLYTAIDHFTHEWQGGLDWHRDRKPVREEGYATDLLGDECVRIIENHDFAARPLFLYHPMFAVHAFNQAPEKYTAAYSGVKDKERRGLLGLCAAMDEQFGRIVAALEKAGQSQNTLLVFLSDNGGSLRHAADNGPLREGKGSYHDGGLRVPAFAYWPGKIAPGRSTGALAYAADIFPTFATLAGASLPKKPLDGFDLAPVLFGDAPSSGRKEILFMLEDSERQKRGALIDWPWKFYRQADPEGGWEAKLYDLAADPSESTDLAASQPERVSAFHARLDASLAGAPTPFWRAGDGQAPKGWKQPPVVGPDPE
jgi:arylsulfatase A-like enzyme